MVKKILFLSSLTIVLNGCSQPTNDKTERTSEDALTDSIHEFSDPIEVVEEQSFDSTRLNYSWLEDFELVNTLVNRIDVPDGFERMDYETGSFADWLRHLPLKEGVPDVLLYNGETKWNQDAHHAVVDLDLDNRDLQQCADAVMRLKAEYHYQNNQFDRIHFNYTSGDNVPYSKWASGKKPVVSGRDVVWRTCSSCDDSYDSFRKYMLSIFNYAGTASLEKELNSKSWNDVSAGDVIIKGGSPGHAVLVLDVAQNVTTGDKVFLIAQSYMPAQQSHILKNPENGMLSPWYSISEIGQGNVFTPEWTFDNNSLMEFED